jgi:hypothetical protein
MATHTGNEGAVYIGANQVAEVRSYTFDISYDNVEDTVMGDTHKTRKATLGDGSGSIECYWDETDTTGQIALEPGTSEVTLNLYPEGNTSGDTYYTCTALISGLSISGSHDGMVEASFSFDASGGISRTTVV